MRGQGADGVRPNIAVPVGGRGLDLLAAYTYDDAGNRTASTVDAADATSYEWDAEGELTAVDETSFINDAGGNRLVRSELDATTMYAGAQEIRIADDGAVTATRYYQFAGKTVAVRTDRGLGDGVTSLVSDHHGTPVAAITNGGHPVRTH